MSKEKAPIFQFLDSINQTKEDVFQSLGDKNYEPYKINHFLSGAVDTVLYANEMNTRHYMPKEMQYDYLRCSIKKKKRYLKWLKKDSIENYDIIQKYYNYNDAKTREALTLLTQEEINKIKLFLDEGGVSGKKKINS